MRGPAATRRCGRRLGKAARALALAVTALGVPGAAAQWASVPSSGGAGSDATVRNASGEEVRIWMDGDRRLRAAFTLAPGLARLDPAGCPTFQVDERTPQDLSRPAHACSVSGARVEVVLAQAEGDRVESPTLLALMNGGSLTVRYRLAHAGYGASRFSLKGSKQALTAAVGEGLSVVGE